MLSLLCVNVFVVCFCCCGLSLCVVCSCSFDIGCRMLFVVCCLLCLGVRYALHFVIDVLCYRSCVFLVVVCTCLLLLSCVFDCFGLFLVFGCSLLFVVCYLMLISVVCCCLLLVVGVCLLLVVGSLCVDD